VPSRHADVWRSGAVGLAVEDLDEEGRMIAECAGFTCGIGT
jgi:hypothetical protein